MKTVFFLTFTALAIPLSLSPAEKPRLFITESQALQVAADSGLGGAKGAISVAGGTSPQSVEVMRSFVQHCPQVAVTSNRDKADYVVRLDHDAVGPTTPFYRGNKVAIFDRNEDLVYSASTRTLSSAVKGACAAIRK